MHIAIFLTLFFVAATIGAEASVRSGDDFVLVFAPSEESAVELLRRPPNVSGIARFCVPAPDQLLIDDALAIGGVAPNEPRAAAMVALGVKSFRRAVAAASLRAFLRAALFGRPNCTEPLAPLLVADDPLLVDRVPLWYFHTYSAGWLPVSAFVPQFAVLDEKFPVLEEGTPIAISTCHFEGSYWEALVPFRHKEEIDGKRIPDVHKIEMVYEHSLSSFAVEATGHFRNGEEFVRGAACMESSSPASDVAKRIRAAARTVLAKLAIVGRGTKKLALVCIGWWLGFITFKKADGDEQRTAEVFSFVFSCFMAVVVGAVIYLLVRSLCIEKKRK